MGNETTSPATDADLLERRFAEQALHNERIRMALIGVVFAIAATTYLIFRAIDHPVFETTFHGKVPLVGPFVVISAFMAYAVGGFVYLGRALERRQIPPIWQAYVSAAVEVSIPSMTITLLFQIMDPAHALVAPPTYAYFLFIALSAMRLDPMISLFTGALAATEFAILATIGLNITTVEQIEPMMTAPPHYVGKVFMLLATGAITAWVAKEVRSGLKSTLDSIADRNRVVDMFGRHVSPQVVNKLLSQPHSATVSESRHVCVMFLDIRNFTTFSEAHSPQEVVDHLNKLFAFMIDEVNDHHGIINKFLGDGFMAIFGAPISTGDDSRNAVAASKAILERMKELGGGPGTDIGIGLHAGAAIIGHVGSATRREYTVIGDVVNVAARIEGLNKPFESSLLISKAVRDAAELHEGESLGPVQVKGRETAIEVFRLA